MSQAAGHHPGLTEEYESARYPHMWVPEGTPWVLVGKPDTTSSRQDKRPFVCPESHHSPARRGHDDGLTVHSSKTSATTPSCSRGRRTMNGRKTPIGW